MISPKSLLKNILLMLLSLMLTLAITEIALRQLNFPKSNWSPWIEDDLTGFKFAPHLNQWMITKEYKTLIQTNELGFRDDPVSDTTQKPRILLIGDSFTFGYGVDQDQIFAHLLEKNLNADVVNASVGGFDLIHHMQFLKYKSLALKPTAVLLVLYIGNDLSGNGRWKVVDGSLKALNPKTNPSTRHRKELKLLTLYRMVRHFLFQYKNIHREEWEMRTEYLEMAKRELSPESIKNYELSIQILTEIKTFLNEHQIPFLVALMPYKPLVERDAYLKLEKQNERFTLEYDLEQPIRRMSQWLSQNSIPNVDLTKDLTLDYINNHLPLYFKKDGHLNPRGHQVVTKSLTAFLGKYFEHAS